ncbi:MAG: L28 family ribosomal protein [Candidatus Caenarcaniphilales bacterium]|nr:L28 family ribosomal protein [Candidatus Caenarcaniphilales bacterium]
MSKYLKSKSGRKCQLSGKKAIKGWRYSFLRSHFNPTSKRRFEVNLQTVSTFDENGTPTKIKVAASTIKRCPEIRLGIENFVKRKNKKRPKGKQKRELLESLGLLNS